MNREIKFRGYSEESNESWNSEDYHAIDFKIGCFIYFKNNRFEEVEDYVKNLVLMQYTGLKDKNNKEIYEGDIIKIDDDCDLLGMNAGEISEVYYEYGGFRMKPKYNKKAKGHLIEEGEYIEIIGNIYQNKELLENE